MPRVPRARRPRRHADPLLLRGGAEPLPWWAAWLWVVPGTATAAVVAALAVAAADRRAEVVGAEWFRSWTAVSAAPTAVLLVLLALLTLLYYRVPRRREPRSSTLVVGLGIGLAAVVLGLASYLPCSESGSPVLSPVAWTLALFVGNVEDVWTSGQCSGPRPLAIEAARLAALSSTFAGFAAVLLAATGQQWDRVRVRWANGTVAVAGLDAGSLTLAGALPVRHPDGTLAVVEPDRDHPRLGRARAAGARVVTGNLSSPSVARSVLTRGGAVTALSVYLLDADASLNRARLDTVARVFAELNPDDAGAGAVLRRPGTAAGWRRRLRIGRQRPPGLRRDAKVPRITVRIDDPWEVEDWRRKNMVGSAGVGVDALSIYETTAQLILDDAVTDPSDRLVIVGSSPLAFALLGELALRHRESRALAGAFGLSGAVAARPVPAEVLLLGPDASGLLEDHRLLQSRFGNAGTPDIAPRAVVTADIGAELSELLRSEPARRAIFADAPTTASLELALRAAARNETRLMWCWTDTVGGFSDQPLRANLTGFNLCFARGNDVPDGRWDRVARMLHEGFRARYGESARPWVGASPEQGAAAADGLPARLSEFFRQSNIRHIRTVLDECQREHWSWGPVDPAAAAGREDDRIPEEILEKVARREHDSWRRYYESHGWRHGDVKQEFPEQSRKRHPTHPDLLDWDALQEVGRDGKTVEGVSETVRLLRALGYRPTYAPPEAESDERTGPVA
jgi:hypothetical protein